MMSLRIQIYVDGSEDYIAYYNVTQNDSKILQNKKPKFTRQISALAEYNAIYEALARVSDGSRVEILSDCQGAVHLLSRGVRLWGTKPKIHKKPVRHKAQSIRRLIKRKKLKVTFTWVPRQHNLAGKMLEKNYMESRVTLNSRKTVDSI